VAAVEAEGELVEVVVKLVVADRALVGAQDPAFDQRGDEVRVRQDHVAGVSGGRDVRDDVLEAVLSDVEVALPAIGAYLAGASDVLEYEVGQGVSFVRSGMRRMRTRPSAWSRSSTAITTIAWP
jgi:hypothetical protein